MRAPWAGLAVAGLAVAGVAHAEAQINAWTLLSGVHGFDWGFAAPEMPAGCVPGPPEDGPVRPRSIVCKRARKIAGVTLEGAEVYEEARGLLTGGAWWSAAGGCTDLRALALGWRMLHLDSGAGFALPDRDGPRWTAGGLALAYTERPIGPDNAAMARIVDAEAITGQALCSFTFVHAGLHRTLNRR